jgi:O-antigen/teichoic acid export membrane protein
VRARTAIICSVLDQGIAAVTNIAVLVVVARLSDAGSFAVFAMVYVVFTVLLGAAGAYVGQELVLHRAEDLRVPCRSAALFTAAASTTAGLLLAAVTAFLPGRTAAALAVLGLVLPVALTQDTLRYCFSVLRLPHLALAADTLRFAAAVPALLLQPDGSGAARMVAVWGVTALPALALSVLLLRRHVAGVRADLRRYLRRGHLGRRFIVEFAVGNASSQLAVLGLGIIATPLAVGALRGATTLFGPLNVLFNSATSFGPPLLTRLGGLRRTTRATMVLGAALAAVAVGWAAALYLLPDGAGRQLLGATWPAASHLLPATGAQYATMALGICGLLTLRVLSPRATLPIQLVFSVAAVVFMYAGYATDGVLGAAWGLFLGSALKAVASWSRVYAMRHMPLVTETPDPAPVA